MSTSDTAAPSDHTDRAIESLAEEFEGVFSRETIKRVVDDTASRWEDARYTSFVPTLVHRFARERLLAVAKNEGRIVTDKPSVLFVCVQNAGRSQMAAALLDHYAEGRVEVRSAGSMPADQIHDNVKDVMAEWDIHLEQEYPKPLTDDVVQASDVVITMGCGDACPVYPGKRYLDWELTDPSGRSVEETRAVRDEIDRRIRSLLDELLEEGPSAS